MTYFGGILEQGVAFRCSGFALCKSAPRGTIVCIETPFDWAVLHKVRPYSWRYLQILYMLENGFVNNILRD